MSKSLFSALFSLSGLCGLVYQILWTRLFSFVLGHTYVAISIIVACFLSGLFLGAWLIGILLPRCRNELKWYGFLELFIGGYAVLMLFGFSFIEGIYQASASLWGQSESLHLFGKFFITLLLILPPTTAMGATLPLVIQYFTTGRSLFADNVGFFYSINTFGGMAGVLAAGFFMTELLGVKEGLIVTAGLNVLLGATVLGLLQRSAATQSREGRSDRGGTSRQKEKWEGQSGLPERALYLAAAGLAGFAALAYEIIWTRGLKFLILNSTYSFTIILAIFVAGIAIGSMLSKRISLKNHRDYFVYGILQVALGVYAVFTIYLFYSFSYGDFFQGNVINLIYDFSYGWLWGIGAFVLTCCTMFLIPTIVMGILFPLLNNMFHERTGEKSGRTVSSVYAINTVGSILGSVVAGFVLLPEFGIKASMMIVSIINLALGVIFIAKSRYRMVPVFAISFLGLAVAISLSFRGRYLMGRNERKSDTVLFYEEGLMSTVKVFDRGNDRMMSIDGDVIASTDRILLQKEKLIAHLPFFLKPDMKDVLAVGLASGISVGSMALHDSIRVIDCVELVKPVFPAAELFSSLNGDIFHNAKVNLIYNDIYAYLKSTNKKYELISSDGKLGSLANANTIMLAADYFELCKMSLKKEGLFIHWIPIITPHEILKVIMDTLRDSFQHVALFYFYPSDIFMIASDAPIVLDHSRMEEVLANQNVRNDLQGFYIKNPLSILSSFIGFYDSGPGEPLRFNTFNQPILEFAYMRQWKEGRGLEGGYRAKNMEFLIENFQKNSLASMFAQHIKRVNGVSYEESVYKSSLHYFLFNAMNFKTGNYQRGLQAYIQWKNSLDF